MAEARLDFKLYGNVKSLDGGRSVDREGSSSGLFAAIGSPLITSGIHEFEFRFTDKGVPAAICGLIGADVAPEEAEECGFHLGSSGLNVVPKGQNPTTNFGQSLIYHPNRGISQYGSLTVIANMNTHKVSFQKDGDDAPLELMDPSGQVEAAACGEECKADGSGGGECSNQAGGGGHASSSGAITVRQGSSSAVRGGRGGKAIKKAKDIRGAGGGKDIRGAGAS